jgi:acyl carrier protein
MREKLKKFIIDTFMYGEGELADDEPLFELGILDSMGLMELLAFIREEIKVQFDRSEIIMDNFQTIDVMIQTIEAKREHLLSK